MWRALSVSITNLLQKLCVTMVKHPGSFKCLSFLHVGCWNVRSLVEIDVDVKTATVCSKDRQCELIRLIFGYKN